MKQRQQEEGESSEGHSEWSCKPEKQLKVSYMIFYPSVVFYGTLVNYQKTTTD